MGFTWTRNWPREFARDQVLKSFQIDSFDGKPYGASKTSTSYSTTSSNPFGHVSVNLNDGQKQQNDSEGEYFENAETDAGDSIVDDDDDDDGEGWMRMTMMTER